MSLYRRYRTREVMVGNVGVGANHPPRIQSMTSSSTRDVVATVEQIIRLSDHGCEIARLTVQGKAEAKACEHIKNELLKKGYTIPLVADIHFYPPAAMLVVDFVDKVRINPGNFADRRAQFEQVCYTEDSYSLELQRIEEKFAPLVEKCKTLKKALRIGTNHGSLSDRIMTRYGDTPEGMVISALEYTEVCRKYDFHDIIFSMKSSNPKVMIAAYRLLVQQMLERGWDYPMHLGVTEAGEGEDGRVKSAMGIGALLLDGIGDTIRVSLTEDPWCEITPCQQLKTFCTQYQRTESNDYQTKSDVWHRLPRREVDFPTNVGLHRDGSVFVEIEEKDVYNEELFTYLGCKKSVEGTPQPDLASVDSVVLKGKVTDTAVLQKLISGGIGVIMKDPIPGACALVTLSELSHSLQKKQHLFSSPFLKKTPVAVVVGDEEKELWPLIEKSKPALILLSPKKHRIDTSRAFFQFLRKKNLSIPVILHYEYSCAGSELAIASGSEMGLLLTDEMGEGVCLSQKENTQSCIDEQRSLGFQLLQAARMRTFKTEFISCPSCGRTLFDLQEVSARIREKTEHLPGVKIAIMGCIVNGPGEMADADFGYVGSRPGKIDLYVGKECVEKNIGMDEADNRLISLIKDHGRWVEPEEILQ